MTRRLLESENEYVENVKNKIFDLHRLLPGKSTDIFPTSIRRCVEKFWEWKSVQDGIQSYYHTWVEIKMEVTDALQIIEGEVIPLLKIAEDNIATYTSFRPQLRELEAYVKSWFDSTSQTSDVTIHEPSVGLQREVEKMEKIINSWEFRYSSLEQDLQTLNKDYRNVKDENWKLASQNNALDNVNHRLQDIQAENNTEIMTLKGKNDAILKQLDICIIEKHANIRTLTGEIERLNREVERLKGEVERLTTQKKNPSENSSNSSSMWSWLGTKKNTKKLLEDLKNSQNGDIKSQAQEDVKKQADESQESQRSTLYRNCEFNIQAFQDILNIDFNMDTTFEKKCYFEDKYLCTVAHNENNRNTDFQLPGTKDYNLVVTWPDGRKEDWTLSVFIWNTGEKKGQLKEFPKGQKSFREFIFTGKIH
jgi:hypothetical protein